MSIIAPSKPKRLLSSALHPTEFDHPAGDLGEADWQQVGFESGSWLQHVSVVSEPAVSSCHDLLRRSAVELPGNLRYAWDGVQILLIGEVPIPKEADEPLAEAGERLHGLLSDRPRGDSNRESLPSPDDALV